MRTLQNLRPTVFPAQALALLSLLGLTLPSFARETVLEDSPGRLVLEVEVPSYSVTSGEGGSRVSAAGVATVTAAQGAPDLPQYDFGVAAGARRPSVSVEPLEWIEVETPGGLRGVPRMKTVHESEPFKDPALFAGASGVSPRVSAPSLYRGLSLRRVTLPLGTYGEGAARARMLKKFKVTVTFANPAASPAPGVQPWLQRADVKNVRGGTYLVSLPARRPLRKAAGAAAFEAGRPLIKIRVGDGQIDGFEEDGVYSLTYEAAREMGLESGVNTGSLRLYTGPAAAPAIKMLGDAFPPTLREIPIEVIEGTNSGNLVNTFDAGDRILFYGQGTSRWKPISSTTGAIGWEFEYDLWSTHNYYFLDWKGLPGGLRLGTTPFTAASSTVDRAPHYLRGEKDLATGACDPGGAWDGESGHIWYWHRKYPCTTPTPGFQDIEVTLRGNLHLSSAAVDTLWGRVSDTILTAFFSHPRTTEEVARPYIQGAAATSIGPLGTGVGWYRRVVPPTDNLLGLDSARWTINPSPYDRLEGFTVRYTRNLVWDGRTRQIFPAAEGRRIAYSLTAQDPSVLAGLTVLRLEGGVARRRLALQIGGGAALFSDSIGAGEDVRYLVYETPKNMPASAGVLQSVPLTSGVLTDLETGDPQAEYLIITSQALLSGALELRTYRDNAARQLPLKTKVVRVEDIYRDWSGGRLSPMAIRDFLRWSVNRPGSQLKYVLFLGDGHYDYRDLRNSGVNSRKPNHVPPFNYDTAHVLLEQYWGSGDPMNTDDFYAVLDSGESWASDAATLELAIGRVPAQTLEHVRSYLEKIRDYEDPANAGEWRGRVLLTADDATQRRALGGVDPIPYHTGQSEDLGKTILAQDPGIRMEKIYLFDYNPNASFLKPEATQDLLNQYNRGVLFSNFFGHGAYNQLADEVLLKTEDGLNRLRNAEKAFTMMVLSCTVGRFDLLSDEGMTEQFLRQKDAAAIAAFGASRESYPGENEDLGTKVAMRLFSPASDSQPMPFGEAVRLGKNAIVSQQDFNKQKYILIGEPVAIIHRPGLGLQVSGAPDSLQALGCGTLSGRVNRGSGKGRISMRIVSGDITKVYPAHIRNVVDKRGQILFESTSDYQDSAFSINYFLPKQIPFGDTAAKIQIFAWDKEQPYESSYLIPNVRLSGTRGNCIEDTDGRGPKISVTGCNLAESGGVDFPDKIKIALPYCLQITVKDTVGGVLGGDGPDQGTTVEVVGRVAPFHPQAGIDDLYTKTYQTTLSGQDIPEGTHLLRVSARDGFGNLGTRQVALQVTADTALRFVRAFNVPNPMKRNGTTFHFATTLPVEEGGDRTQVRIDRIRFDLRIFNQQGYMVQEFRDAKSGITTWNGKDAWGRQLANGVYFYQVTATWSEDQGSPSGGRQVSKKNVLVISR